MQFLARHDAEDLQSQPSEAEMGVGRGSEVQSHSQPHMMVGNMKSHLQRTKQKE